MTDQATLLRLVLRANASTSFVSGLVLSIAPATADRLLDTGHTGWVRAVGLSLLPFAAFVAVLSARSEGDLRAVTPHVIWADAAWVILSGASVAAGWYSTAGAVAVSAMAAVVGLVAILQWWGLRRICGPSGRATGVPDFGDGL